MQGESFQGESAMSASNKRNHFGSTGWLFSILALAAALVFPGCATQSALTPDQIAAVLSAPERSDADKANDTRRKAHDLLAFIDARPGMRVLDVGSGGGYTAELLARVVGANGRVIAHNSPYFMENLIKDRFAQRLKSYSMSNLSLSVQPFENPLPADVSKGSIDLVTFLFVYHDLGWAGVDRAQVNRAVFEALKHGGYYVLADHSGRLGTGITESKSLHRIEQALLLQEVEAAGFKLVAEGQFLRNPLDPRDKSVFKPAQPNDEFVLKFQKP
jgi:predicted methyltransferase